MSMTDRGWRPLTILVLGMHRSGTSAISGVLNLLGVSVPGQLMSPTRDNPRGYFEIQRVVDLNDQLLARFGSRWDDPLPLKAKVFDSPNSHAAIRELSALVGEEFGDDPFALIKDPRICRLLPLWLEALALSERRIVAILPVRHPLEVVDSLRRRDAMPRGHALVLWIQHVLAAERLSRGLPRCFVTYDNLLEDWRSAVDNISDQLGLVWPKDSIRVGDAIDEFLSAELRHHRSAQDKIGSRDPLSALCLRVWRAVKELCADGNHSSALADLDRAARKFDGAIGILSPLLAAFDHGLIASRRQLGEGLEREANLSAALTGRDKQIELLNQTLIDQEQRHSSEAEALRADTARLCAEAEMLRAESEQLKSEITAERETAHRAEEQLRAAAARIWAAEREIVALREQAERAEARASHVAAAAEAAAARAAELDRNLADARVERDRLNIELDGILRSTFWQATAPARGAVSVLPPAARRQGRRIARLAYWLLTPHRTRARMAYFRSQARQPRRMPADEQPERAAATAPVEPPAWVQLFDADWYLEKYPDVAADGAAPLDHFIHRGAAEGRDPNPLFETSWYLEANPDVAKAGINALQHYVEQGAAEGRDPSPRFDTSWYLEVYGDVAESGLNPLLHYIKYGAAEGRATHAGRVATVAAADGRNICSISAR